jgi:hypothetical protein
MMNTLVWLIPLILNPPQQGEMTDRMVPIGFQGNFWGPQATLDRRTGKLPPIEVTPQMTRWDTWGRKVLRDGDIVFRSDTASRRPFDLLPRAREQRLWTTSSTPDPLSVVLSRTCVSAARG